MLGVIGVVLVAGSADEVICTTLGPEIADGNVSSSNRDFIVCSAVFGFCGEQFFEDQVAVGIQVFASK